MMKRWGKYARVFANYFRDPFFLNLLESMFWACSAPSSSISIGSNSTAIALTHRLFCAPMEALGTRGISER